MALIKNLINQAYAQIGIIADDEEADGTDGALGVTMINQILAQANATQAFPFLQAVIPYTVALNQSTFKIGTSVGYEINATRPEFINRILYAASPTASNIQLTKLDIPDLYARTYANSGSSGSPRAFAYNAGYPLGTIYFDTRPSMGAMLTIIYMESIPVVTIDTDLTSIPSKYDDFLVASLARKLAVHKMRPPEIVSNADSLYKTAKNFIITSNARSQIPTLDFGVNEYASHRTTFLG